MKKILFSLAGFFCFLAISAQPSTFYTLTSAFPSGHGTISKYQVSTNTLSSVFDFNGTNGSQPRGSLIKASNGKLYGMTSKGGSNDKGTIFSYDSSGTHTVLHHFNGTNGQTPYGSLFQASNGKLYGMTYQGGSAGRGNLFSFDPESGIHTLLYSFTNFPGGQPYGSIIQASDGKLYGMAGGNPLMGVLFSFDIVSNTLNILYNFNGSGRFPAGSLLQLSNGKLYGMSRGGGLDFGGTVFSFDLSSNVFSNVVHMYSVGGREPMGDVVQAPNGKLYGLAAFDSGRNNTGILFSFDPVSGTSTRLHTFDSAGGAVPKGTLVVESNGLLYGMTSEGGSSNLGTVFSFDPATNTYTKLKDFNGTNGASPQYGALLKVREPFTFRFTGPGNWSDPTKWNTGTVPQTASLIGNDSLIINGVCNYEVGMAVVPCVLLVSENATLNLSKLPSSVPQYFKSERNLIVKGILNNGAGDSLINNGALNITGTINNYGPFKNNNPAFTIENGGTFSNGTGGSFQTGPMIQAAGGNFVNSAVVTGDITFSGDFVNGGIIAPGNSPGTATVLGNYTATSSATFNCEVAGASNGAYDVITVTGAVTVGGALNVTLINGYTVASNTTINIITGNSISGTFATVNLPPGYLLVYNSNNIQLKSASTLPVNFLSLNAKKEGSQISLVWKVEGEQSVIRYDVERSSDGRAFTKAGSVAASGQNQYSLTDALQKEKTFYRVKSTDADGTYKYSSIISFDQGKTVVTLKVFPVPANNTVTIQHGATAADSKIKITSIEGRILMVVLPKRDTQQTTINTARLNAGTYIIRLENGDQWETIKFVKQ